MFWLFLVSVPLLIGLVVQYKNREDGFVGGCLGAAIACIIPVIAYFGSMSSCASMESFYAANARVYTRAYELTKDAPVTHWSHPSGNTDLGIQLENRDHSRLTVESINFLSRRTAEYNKDLTWYRMMAKNKWLWRPAMQFPSDSLRMMKVDTGEPPAVREGPPVPVAADNAAVRDALGTVISEALPSLTRR